MAMKNNTMEQHNQTGGTRHRNKRTNSRRKRGGSTHKRNATRHRRVKTKRNVHRRKHQKGGFLQGALGAAREALLPFLMYTAQKRVQHRSRKNRTSRKSPRK